MNLRLVLNQLGLLLSVLAGAFLALAAWAAVEAWRGAEHEREAATAFLITTVVSLVTGAAMWYATRSHSSHLGRREATLLVVVSWVVGGMICALPYWIWQKQLPVDFPEQGFATYVRCLFESISGLTTCGATVLTDIESLPHSILLWRSTTQWVGGLGIVVLFVAVLPSLGAAGKRMFLTETTGVTPEGLRPHVRETARVLWLIYLAMTLAQIFVLMLVGMGVFDAICHTFSSVATGGFSTRNASVAAFDSVAIDLVITLFMVLGGVNFALYYRLLRGQYRNVLRDTELRWYLMLLFGGSAIVAISLAVAGRPIVSVAGTESELTTLNVAQQSLFTVTSMQTSSGFAVANYDTWPVVAKAVIVALAFVGGCGGSTGSGIKVIRILISVRTIWHEIEREFRPSVVRPLKVGKSVIDVPVRIAALSTVVAGVMLLGLGAVVLLVIEPDPRMDFTTAASASLMNLLNVGPALGAVGPALNYGWMSGPSLLVLIPLMILGRLEIFAVLALLTRRFWSND